MSLFVTSLAAHPLPRWQADGGAKLERGKQEKSAHATSVNAMRTDDEIYKRIEAARGKMLPGSFDCRAGACVVRRRGIILSVLATDAKGWDHVSVSTEFRNPTWEEMCFVKEIFFEDEETCIQYHPAKSRDKNVHQYCRHLWRPQEIPLPDPPSVIVGPERFFA